MTSYADKLLNRASQRACHRKGYVSLYIVIRAMEPFALRDDADGFILAFTDWQTAIRASVPFKGYVTNWDEFNRRGIRANMLPTPTAMRVIHTDRKGVTHRYHAEFDATHEELRTLNQIPPRDEKNAPQATRALRAKAKVWEEKS